MDQYNWLGSDVFEQLQMMKHKWKHDAVDLANLNSATTEDVSLKPFKDYFTWETNYLDSGAIIPTLGNVLVV